jgi:hypothetical protein
MIQFQAINFVVTETRTFHWLPTLREEHRLRVFQRKVPRNMSGFKGWEVTGGSGKLCNEELQNLNSLLIEIKSKRLRWNERIARIERL